MVHEILHLAQISLCIGCGVFCVTVHVVGRGCYTAGHFVVGGRRVRETRRREREGCQTELFGPFLTGEGGPEEVIPSDAGEEFVY